MRSLLISLNILCFYLIMSSGAMGQNVNINETPKQFEVNQAIPLPGNGSLTVAVEPRDKWKDEARNGTAIGLKLSFAPVN